MVFLEQFRNIPWNIPYSKIFGYFYCLAIYLEYSWNIPYSIIFKIFTVYVFFPNIPYSNKLKSILLRFFLEYSIFHKKQKNVVLYSIKYEIILVEVYFWNIPDIFHIPKNMKLCLLRYIFGIFRNIPYSKNVKLCLLRYIYGIFLEYSIFQKI